MAGYTDAEVEITVVAAHFGSLFNRGLSELLHDERYMRMLQSGLDLSELEAVIARDSPRIAILSEGTLSNSSVPRRLQAIQPSIGLVLLLHGLAEREGRQLLAFGVTACVALESAWSDIATAIRFAAEGKQIVVSAESGRAQLGSRESTKLTRRECEVLQMVQAGCSNPQIARSLQIGVETVRSHVQRVNRKLGITRRSDLVRIQRSEWPSTTLEQDEPGRK